MPNTSGFTVTVTLEYEISAHCSFDPALRVAEALRTGGMPWPVAVKIDVAASDA